LILQGTDPTINRKGNRAVVGPERLTNIQGSDEGIDKEEEGWFKGTDTKASY
jgi:hypothetical protein